jgi:hypothetical protein
VRLLFALALLLLALILPGRVLWASLSWAATTRCTNYGQKSLGPLQGYATTARTPSAPTTGG